MAGGDLADLGCWYMHTEYMQSPSSHGVDFEGDLTRRLFSSNSVIERNEACAKRGLVEG